MKPVKYSYLHVLFMTVVLLIGRLDYLSAYPSGAPSNSCKGGLPFHSRHGVMSVAQNTTCPYTVNINSTTFQPGETIRIEISTNEGDGFRGLFLQMSPEGPGDDGFKPAGTFSRVTKNTKLTRCGREFNTLTHSDAFTKERVEVDWNAPLYIKSNIVVRLTLLANFSTFWGNIDLPVITNVHTGEQQAPEKLRKPWLKEIAETVKGDKKHDKQSSRDRVRGRFTKGMSDMMSPSDYIMIHYVNDMLSIKASASTDRNRTTNNASDIVKELSEFTVPPHVPLAESPPTASEYNEATGTQNNTPDTEPYEEDRVDADSKDGLFDDFVQALLSDNVEAAELMDTVFDLMDST